MWKKHHVGLAQGKECGVMEISQKTPNSTWVGMLHAGLTLLLDHLVSLHLVTNVLGDFFS